MSHQRLEAPPEHQQTADQRAVVDALTSGPRGGFGGPFHALLRSPGLADRVRRLGDAIRFEGSMELDDRLLELTVLIVCRHGRQQFEWSKHEHLALVAGIDPCVVEAVHDGRRPETQDAEVRAVHELLTELLAHHCVSDPTYENAATVLGERRLVECVTVAGYFAMLGMLLNVDQTPPFMARPSLRQTSANGASHE